MRDVAISLSQIYLFEIFRPTDFDLLMTSVTGHYRPEQPDHKFKVEP
jgi:hypothetical protein